MTIPTIRQLEADNLPRVRFRVSNGAEYFMDHSLWRTMPCNVVFYVRPMRGFKKQSELLAPGYGVKDNYGNGSIFISDAEIKRWSDPIVIARKWWRCRL
jgi:hypothetical protein